MGLPSLEAEPSFVLNLSALFLALGFLLSRVSFFSFFQTLVKGGVEGESRGGRGG